MALKINKPGSTVNDASYGALYIELDPFIELHYDRVSINTKCYDWEDVSLYGLEGYWTNTVDASGIDVSTWVDPAQPIIPKNWERFNPIKVDFEEDASTKLQAWSVKKTIAELTRVKNIPYEYMKYEDNVYELDPSSGEPVVDPSTGQPVVIHSKGELIKKENGVFMFYTKQYDRFCEIDDVSILYV
jgi:hypothetical protein